MDIFILYLCNLTSGSEPGMISHSDEYGFRSTGEIPEIDDIVKSICAKPEGAEGVVQ